jgi:hypothetical protein
MNGDQKLPMRLQRFFGDAEPLAPKPLRTGDDEAMLDWLVDQLFLEDVAKADAYHQEEERLGHEELKKERLEEALRSAWCGFMEPLRELYPHLTPFLSPPKLGRGQKFPKPESDVDASARDVQRFDGCGARTTPDGSGASTWARPRRRSSPRGCGASK